VTEALVVCGLGALVFVALIGWYKTHVECKEWQVVCATLGNEYDKVVLELAEQRHSRRAPVNVKRDTRWVN
jgi:TM2 domain-containing membrane protein YozV